MPCPECEEFSLYRSKSKNLKEKVFKKITRYKLYRCRECEWRGWLKKPKYANKKDMYRDVIFYAILLIIALIVFIWLMSTRPF